MLATNAAHTQILYKLCKNSDHTFMILLDIKMPVLDGFELCEKIIELDNTVHIIIITASEQHYEQFRNQHYPELGKINYIQKPIAIWRSDEGF
jgi:CheY-like chemotaxis protein